jgi:glycosyltransferase involved in cell wall biosynthesis
LHTGFAAATGDIVIVQDADLEYNPSDIPSVIRPIVLGQADVAFGSRYLHGRGQDESRLHRLGNGLLTALSNRVNGLELTDMETCYKAFRRGVLRDLHLKQKRFGFEPEITAKLARRQYRIKEVPIRYAPRGYAQGKKIGVIDLINTLYCIVRYGWGD